MYHIPQIFTRRKRTSTMDPRHHRGRRLDRRNAAKRIDYEAGSSSSSLTDSSSPSSLVTRSLDLSDRTSFRVEGTEGEFDRICRSLGLSGPEDFAIPTAAWEAMKFRSASDIQPRCKYGSSSRKVKEVILQEQEQDQDQQEINLCARDLDTLRIEEGEATESAELKTCCPVEVVLLGGGIKGVRPPLLKPPPSMSLPLMDDKCSTWDILRDFAPESERASFNIVNRDLSSDDEEDRIQGSEVGEETQGRAQAVGAALNGMLEVVEENLVLSEATCSFSTSNDDDSSSTTTDPTNISPNVRLRRNITDWEKGELLGRGSFGSVYEGISADGFFFVVKEVSLLDQGSQGKQSIYQLEQEIALLSQFEHENIVQYYGTDKDESKLYIFLELVAKGSLLSLYQRYNLRDSQVSAYTRQILHGLKYLHDRDVVHRDIKCANILVDASGSVKLADFGLAKATKFNDVKSCKGTALWMAPEVVNRKNQGYGLPADIWSLGCTVLEMLTRQLPYSHLESMQALFRIGRGELPPVPDSLSPDARDFILQCLRVNPDDRPTAAHLLLHAFVKRPLITTNSGSASPYIGRRS